MRARSQQFLVIVLVPVAAACYLAHERPADGRVDATVEPDSGAGDAGPCAGGCADMVAVPAGPFWMGCAPHDPFCLRQPEESPYHEVFLSAFAIERTEVTHRAYGECVAEGGCQPAHRSAERPDDDTTACDRAADPDEPIVCVDWYQARDYCEWRGRRLCTEAEWEKAARGTDGRLFPWGNETATCRHAVSFDCLQTEPDPVASRPDYPSPYGALDMAGNVWEWIHDWHDDAYYSHTPVSDPQGPATGTRRGMRGGYWRSPWQDVRTSYRGGPGPEYWSSYLGFRCCR